MRLQQLSCQVLLIIAVSCAISTPLFAWQHLSNDIDIRCSQENKTSLRCYYRLLFPGPASNIRAYSDGLELPVEKTHKVGDDVTAIIFLIDTSDPGRQNVIEKNIRQLEKMLDASGPSQQLGLASFDKKLRILAPIGSSKKQIIAAAKNIKAKGRTTELYRSLLLTIEKLSRVNAGRKAIYLFSDGQAEDKAYFHSDVIKAARKKGIVINSIGFPRSVTLSVALQTLRRLSEETGGTFTEADSHYDLEEKFYRDPYSNVDRGEGFTVDMSALATNTMLSPVEVTLEFTTDIGSIKTRVPVSLPVSPAEKAPAPLAAPIQVAPPPAVVKMAVPVSESEKIDFWLWYGLPVALVILFLIALVTLILIYRKQPDKTTIANSFQQQNKPFAYLVSQEEHSRRYPILSTTWRIGRSRDNELSLDDTSISRLHAEIHRDNDGSFFITDMSSLNGVYVNEEQVVSKQKLQEGDIIEIGDIYLRFTLYSEDYQLSDDTAIQKTRVPAD